MIVGPIVGDQVFPPDLLFALKCFGQVTQNVIVHVWRQSKCILSGLTQIPGCKMIRINFLAKKMIYFFRAWPWLWLLFYWISTQFHKYECDVDALSALAICLEFSADIADSKRNILARARRRWKRVDFFWRSASFFQVPTRRSSDRSPVVRGPRSKGQADSQKKWETCWSWRNKECKKLFKKLSSTWIVLRLKSFLAKKQSAFKNWLTHVASSSPHFRFRDAFLQSMSIVLFRFFIFFPSDIE